MPELTPENKWFPSHHKGEIDPIAQAKLYPYPAPMQDFWMRGGEVFICQDPITADALAGRLPVIAVGSNRAPLQLRRKFTKGDTIPVTTCVLHDCDVVYAAALSYYCAMPATAYPCINTSVNLNIVWLNDQQLSHMHNTEALGIAYDFIRFNDGMVDHGRRQNHAIFQQPVYGYQSRSPMLQRGGKPIAHRLIPAKGRVFAEMEQSEALNMVKNMGGYGDIALDDWLVMMRGDKAKRQHFTGEMAKGGIEIKSAPWEVMDAKASDTAAYT